MNLWFSFARDEHSTRLEWERAVDASIFVKAAEWGRCHHASHVRLLFTSRASPRRALKTGDLK